MTIAESQKPSTQKLQKILAESGLGSRREMERWIVAGRIQVNQQIARLGDRVDEKAVIAVDGTCLKPSADTSCSQILLYHKPVGEVCTRYDPEGRPTVFDRLPKLHAGRWVMVGRLDYNTSGLLLFTNDGELAHRLMHPSFHMQRVYKVRVYGFISQPSLTRLLKGVALEDGIAKFDQLKAIENTGRNYWYEIKISSGKNRIIRRLLESQGVKINRLIRISFGKIVLPPELKTGEYRLLKHPLEY